MTFLVSLTVFLGIASVGALPISKAAYTRPPPVPQLPMDHPLLVRKSGPHDPEQIFIALAGPGMAVSWVTYPQDDDDFMRAATARAAGSGDVAAGHHHSGDDRCRHLAGLPLLPTVQLGLEPGQYTVNVTGVFDCYSGEDYDSGALHHVVLGRGAEGPLTPNTVYYYRCGDPNLAWSPEFSFKTSPPVGAASLPYTLGLVGDLGQTENSLDTLQHMEALRPDSVVLAGDLSYADGYQPRWDSWGRLMQPYATSVPWMMIEGNHEIEYLNDERGFTAYETRFWYPTQQCGSTTPLYYSYEVAGAHMLMLGSYVDFDHSSEQYAWLKKDLVAVDRARTPWLIAVLHAPWYNSNTHHYGEGDPMMDSMEDLLFEFGVDVLVAGHVHAYERSVPSLHGHPHTCGITHLTVGDGGNREGLDTEYISPPPNWSAVKEASFGAGVLRLENSSHAVWSWHRNRDGTFEVADEVVLVREDACTRQRRTESVALS